MSDRSVNAPCATCRGRGSVSNALVSAATLRVTGVQTTVRRSCPQCAGGRVAAREGGLPVAVGSA